MQALPEGDREARLACLPFVGRGQQRPLVGRPHGAGRAGNPRMGYDHDAAAFKQWRKRLERAQESEERAWEELNHPACFSHIAPRPERIRAGEFQAEAGPLHPIARAWLVRKNLREHPQRRAYLLFVELPGMDDEDRYELCRSLERTLELPGRCWRCGRVNRPRCGEFGARRSSRCFRAEGPRFWQRPGALAGRCGPGTGWFRAIVGQSGDASQSSS